MFSKIKFYFSKAIIKIFGDVQFFPSPMFCLFWGDTHYQVKGEETRDILKNLQKGDILLARYDRYVSSWFIPGFYTHVALYAGDEKVVHAVTKGVREEDILSLLRTDYITILRPRNCSEDQIDEAIARARKWIGCEYDFIFSNDTDDRFYCSELVMKAYGEHLKELGVEEVISPDEYSKHHKVLELIHESREWRKINK